MNQREKQCMHLLKQILDAYAELPISQRMALSESLLRKKVAEIHPVLKLFKNDVLVEIQDGVAESGINQRFKKQYR